MLNFLHQFMVRLDPRVKLLGIILSLCILTTSRNSSIWIHAANIGPALILAGLSHSDYRQFVRRFRYIAGFLILAAVLHLVILYWIPHLIQSGSHPLFFIVSTSLCGLLLGLFLTGTTHPNTLTRGLIQMRIPPRAAWILILAYRYLPLIRAEVTTSFSAAFLRGFRDSRHKRRNFAFLISGIIQRTYAQAQRTGDAMFLRGFDLNKRHVSSRSLTCPDILFLVILPLSFILIRVILP